MNTPKLYDIDMSIPQLGKLSFTSAERARGRAKAAENRALKKALLEKSLKKCGKCGEEKPLTEFHEDSKTYTGYASHCKQCKKAKK
jgi:hypothetical protein